MSLKGIGLRLPAIIVILFVSICSLSLWILPGIPEAGLYHAQGDAYNTGATIACSQCHTMHGVQGGDSNSLIYGGTVITYPALLRAATALELCLYCHENNDASLTNPRPPDIMGVVPTQQTNPSAGNFAHGDYVNNDNRHDLGVDVSLITPPGYTGTDADWVAVRAKFGDTFNCLYCHDNHGNTNYRNLRYNPGNPVDDDRNDSKRVDITYTFADTELDAWNKDNLSGSITTDVHNWATNTSWDQNVKKYDRANVRFRRKPLDTDTTDRGISAWCGKCHEDFYGISGDGNMGGVGIAGEGSGDTGASPWVRHPVGDVSIQQGTNAHGDVTTFANADLAFVRAVEMEYPTAIDGNEQPLCLSCHYAHGGGNPNRPALGGDDKLDHSNLVFLDNEGDINLSPTTGEGGAYDVADGMLRNLCQKCHNQ